MKLHLGCGNKFIKGYVHIDAIDFPHVDHVSAIDSLSFIEESSVELIYACHVLEHFKRRDVSKVLKEWNRVLIPGGILRLAVPNFEKICEVYTETKNLDLVIGPLFGGQNYLYNIHYNIFDLKSLQEQLFKSGFNDVRKYDWRETDHSDVDDYSQAYIPHMDKDNGTLISLNVECKKY
jgi:predicted SAM-dependent methyltransferase